MRPVLLPTIYDPFLRAVAVAVVDVGHQRRRLRWRGRCHNFPGLLDILEEHCADELAGIALGEIEWYRRLRKQLYHQGNGLTVEL
jgi:hypothetical protein